MSRVSLQDGAGPGSSISLAPETIKVRNALIEKFTGEPLDEMNHFMNTALATEKNELRRIGILAARIFLLRARVANLQDFNRDPSMTQIPEVNVATLDLGGASMDAIEVADEPATEIEDGWARLKMTSPGEVQGVRFLSGAIIDAKPEDAEKLIRSGKAVRVDEIGNIIEPQQDDFADTSDAATAGQDDTGQDGTGSSAANTIDDADASIATPEDGISSDSDAQSGETINDDQPDAEAPTAKDEDAKT
ncbi:hypothetical protein AB8879_09545 [Alphaproteobacteria bacterium LSUCC0744]